MCSLHNTLSTDIRFQTTAMPTAAKAAVVRNKIVKKAKNLLFIGWIWLVKNFGYR